LSFRLRAEHTAWAKPFLCIYKYIIEDTIEERIEKILAEKQLLFDELVDSVSIDLKSKLSSEELFGLFGLVPPENLKT